MKSMTLPLIAVLVWLPYQSLSAELETPKPVEIKELYQSTMIGELLQEAMAYSPKLREADKQYQAAERAIQAAGVLPNPKVQLSHFVESIQTRTGPQKQAILLSQPVPWFGKLSREREIATTQAKSLWHAYMKQQFKLADKVAQRGINIAFLNKSIEISEKNLKLLKGLEPIISEKVEAGGNLRDLLQLQVEVKRIEVDISRKTAQRDSELAVLSGDLGRVPERHYSPLNLTLSRPKGVTENKQLWLKAIQQQSPDIAVLKELESSFDARARLAKLANRPDFTVGVNYIRTGDAIDSSMPDSGTDPWAIMVGVSLPIWQGKNSALAAQARLKQDAITESIQALQIELRAKGKSHILLLEDAENRLDIYQQQLLPLAQQSYEITTASYQSGKASILDLIESERTILQLELEYWAAASTAWKARWTLTSLSGGLWLN